jgi:hypothetical protein
MKKYNKQIEVTVQVDSIAKMLLDLFKPVPQAEEVTETIIDTALQHSTIGFIYNALTGVSNALVGLVKGMTVTLNDVTIYGYICTNISDNVWEQQKYTLLTATVSEVNPYHENGNVLIEYTKHRSDGTPFQDNKWIDYSDIILPDPDSKPANAEDNVFSQPMEN